MIYMLDKAHLLISAEEIWYCDLIYVTCLKDLVHKNIFAVIIIL